MKITLNKEAEKMISMVLELTQLRYTPASELTEEKRMRIRQLILHINDQVMWGK